MSIFNMVVKPHPFAPILLLAINWAQPTDPKKKYPLLGRMRYAWMSEDYKHIKLLLKDGPDSWTEEEYKAEIMKQIEGHETFVSVNVESRDRVYIVATFTPIADAGYERPVDMDYSRFDEIIRTADENAVSDGIVSITKSPWEIFDQAMADMENGKTTPEIENLKESFSDMLGEIDAQDKLDDIAKERGVDFKKDHIFTIGPDGKMKSID